MVALEPSSSCPSNGAAGPGVSAAPPQFVVPGLIWIVSVPNGGRPTVGPVQTSAIVVVVVGGAVVRDAVPVVSGVRSTASGAWNPAMLGRQSMLVWPAPVGVHGAPASGLVDPVFVIHVTSHAPARHCGQGAASLPVM